MDTTLNDGFTSNKKHQDYLKKVKDILECSGKFPTTSTMGDNYHEMQDITERLND